MKFYEIIILVLTLWAGVNIGHFLVAPEGQTECAKKHNVYQCEMKWEPVK